MTRVQRIEQVAYAKGKVTIAYQEEDEVGLVTHLTLVSEQEPSPAFRRALAELAEDVAWACEVSLSGDNPIDVRSVKFKYDADDYRVVVSGVRAYRRHNGLLALNTPALAVPYEASESGERGFMTDDMYHRVESLQRAALDYLNGARSQLSLFEEV